MLYRQVARHLIGNDAFQEVDIVGITRSITKYGVTVDKGMGIFNGDMGIIREISSYKETLTVEYDEKRTGRISVLSCWMNWNWRMRSRFTNPREANIRRW